MSQSTQSADLTTQNNRTTATALDQLDDASLEAFERLWLQRNAEPAYSEWLFTGTVDRPLVTAVDGYHLVRFVDAGARERCCLCLCVLMRLRD